MSTILTDAYNKAKDQVMSNPTLENWYLFLERFEALPSLLPDDEPPSEEAFQEVSKLAAEFSSVARHVAANLPFKEIMQSTSLIGAYLEIQYSKI